MRTTPHPAVPGSPASLPLVAMVGRPNVGKSALFNRIVGRRYAIVHGGAGVTRDSLIAQACWNGRRFRVGDTGGLGVPPRGSAADAIAAAVQQRAADALAEAPIAVLVCDAAAGLLPADREIAAHLRAASKRVLVAANKCDEPEHDAAAAAFEALGFPVWPVSALHARGVADLLDAVVQDLPEAPPDASVEPLRVAVVGRPNVGKSSFLNRLLRCDRLIVSSVPGTTRDSVEIPATIGSGPHARRYVFVDTAGMRRKTKARTAVERFSLMRAEAAIARADVVVVLLDAAQGPTALDKTIATLVEAHHKGCVLAVNKWDLMSGVSTQREYARALAEAVPFFAQTPTVFVSARTGFNIRRSLDTLDAVAARVRLRLPTPALNRAIQQAVARVQPPMLHGKRLRVYYAAQVGTAPLRVALYVNDPNRLPAAYTQYLARCLRTRFDLHGAPLVLQPRHHREHRPAPSP